LVFFYVAKGKGERSAFVRDHPLILRTRVPLDGGAILVELLSATEEPLVTVFIAATPNRRGTTSICWRGFASTAYPAGMPWSARLRGLAGAAPFELFSQLDGAAIAALEVAPSWDRQRVIDKETA
jgi:hypothetical protein